MTFFASGPGQRWITSSFLGRLLVLNSSPPNLSWRRQLVGPKQIAWIELRTRIEGIVLSHGQIVFYWNLSSNGKFSVKSLYDALMMTNLPNINQSLRKLKIPLKIKIFLWYLRRGVILAKDNLAK
ncbi:hypothetical protein U9M48_038460, partial [Paspalum notatum var. saurae]